MLEKYKGIGVRIEDDVVIIVMGVDIFIVDVLKDIDEIEVFMVESRD